MSLRPTLSLVHFDGVSRKVREDFYVLRERTHRRFFTSVRHFADDREWLIYHKQPKSPRACFEIPFSATISALFSAPGTPKIAGDFFAQLAQLGQNLHYQGLATMQLLGVGDESRSNGPSNITMLHYKVRQEVVARDDRDHARRQSHQSHPLLDSAMPPLHLYLHPLTHQPLVVTTPHLRIDLLSFQVVDDKEAIAKMQPVFEPQRASKAKCVPFTSQTDRRKMRDEL